MRLCFNLPLLLATHDQRSYESLSKGGRAQCETANFGSTHMLLASRLSFSAVLSAVGAHRRKVGPHESRQYNEAYDSVDIG